MLFYSCIAFFFFFDLEDYLRCYSLVVLRHPIAQGVGKRVQTLRVMEKRLVCSYLIFVCLQVKTQILFIFVV